MTNTITNKDYITITADGITVGGKPAKKYLGEEIWNHKNLPGIFRDIQQIVKREYGAAPIEMRVKSSETVSEYAKPGNPSPEHGKNAWFQFVFANGVETSWVFCEDAYSSVSDCAGRCALECSNCVRFYTGYRSRIFGPIADAIKSSAQLTEVSDMPIGNQILKVKIMETQSKTL